MKKVYFYNPKTFEYSGEAVAQLDPVATKKRGKDVYALPVNATFVIPPEVEDFKISVYNTDTDTWEQKTSYKGNYKINSQTGIISEITNNELLKSYEYLIDKDILVDVLENPIKYDVIDGKVTDISKMQRYQNKYNIRRYTKRIQEAKEAYTKFQETPVDYKGMKFLPRYIDDYAKLANRSFPMEIWDCTGTQSKLMSANEFAQLRAFLESLDSKAYSKKKNSICKYKLEIEKLEKENG